MRFVQYHSLPSRPPMTLIFPQQLLYIIHSFKFIALWIRLDLCGYSIFTWFRCFRTKRTNTQQYSCPPNERRPITFNAVCLSRGWCFHQMPHTKQLIPNGLWFVVSNFHSDASGWDLEVGLEPQDPHHLHHSGWVDWPKQSIERANLIYRNWCRNATLWCAVDRAASLESWHMRRA